LYRQRLQRGAETKVHFGIFRVKIFILSSLLVRFNVLVPMVQPVRTSNLTESNLVYFLPSQLDDTAAETLNYDVAFVVHVVIVAAVLYIEYKEDSYVV